MKQYGYQFGKLVEDPDGAYVLVTEHEEECLKEFVRGFKEGLAQAGIIADVVMSDIGRGEFDETQEDH